MGMSEERHWLGGLFHTMVLVTAVGPMAKENVPLREMPCQEWLGLGVHTVSPFFNVGFTKGQVPCKKWP